MKTTRRQLVQGIGMAAPALALAAPLSAAASASTAPARRTTEDTDAKAPALSATLILVRHTEKDTDDRRDPSLSEAGVTRAKDFARMFGATGVTALIHTEYKRTRDTLAPLAESLGIESETVGASEMPRLLQRLQEAKPGEVIAVAGHSNTIPAIAHAFGVLLPELDPIPKGSNLPHGYLPHGAYDRVHVLTPNTKPGSARLVELRYGEPSA